MRAFFVAARLPRQSRLAAAPAAARLSCALHTAPAAAHSASAPAATPAAAPPAAPAPRRARARSLLPPPDSPLLTIAPRVRAALRAGRAVVALESTIISHGMPWPANLAMAREVEALVRAGGAEPATIAILNGVCRVGLDDAALELLAAAPASSAGGGGGGAPVLKCARREIAQVVAARGHGATTVAGTMALARAAGIRVFATGGIGGVHRDAATHWDISADLTELGRTPVAVVCAGVKSILDIAKTLEVLETLGAGVITYTGRAPGDGGGRGSGSSDGSDGAVAAGTPVDFPAFFSPRSGVPSPAALASLADIARVLATAAQLGYDHGHVIAVPPPASASGAAITAAVDAALAEAAARGIAGRDVTPFLLRRVAELTHGASLALNIALVKRNAAVAAELAVALAALEQPLLPSAPRKAAGAARQRAPAPPAGARAFSTRSAAAAASGRGGADAAAARAGGGGASGYAVVVLGGSVLDTVSRPQAGVALVQGTSNPGVITQSFGGVGRNIAEVVARLGPSPVALVTALGGDAAGSALARSGGAPAAAAPVHVFTPAALAPRTPAYAALLDGDGELVAAVADMAALDALQPADLLAGARAGLPLVRRSQPDAVPPQQEERASLLGLLATASSAPDAGGSFLVVDANIPASALAAVCDAATASGAAAPPPYILFEPISVSKCERIVAAAALDAVTIVKPNRHEVLALARAVRRALGLAEDATAAGDEEVAAAAAAEGSSAAPGRAAAARPAASTAAAAAAASAPSSWAAIGRSLSPPAAAAARAAAPAEAAVDDDEEGDVVLDYQLLTAAQTVLAAMVRPRGAGVGDALPAASPVLRAAREHGADAALRACAAALEADAARGRGADACRGAAFEGRKHVLVTLGRDGVLWLSAPPAPSAHLADLLLALPFFRAAAAPALGLDFRLVPAPAPARVAKVTGAGDTFAGALVAALLRRRSMAAAVRTGLAAAKIAVESELVDSASTVAARLSWPAVQAALRDVAEVDDAYDE